MRGETREQQLNRLRLSWVEFAKKQGPVEITTSDVAVDPPRPKRNQKAPEVEIQLKGINAHKVRKILRKFRGSWNALESKEIKLAALRNIADQFHKRKLTKYRLVTMRAQFNKKKHWLLPINGERCATCDNPARVRHHIIPLDNGGRNNCQNLVPLCHGCHAIVHPWLAERRAKKLTDEMESEFRNRIAREA